MCNEREISSQPDNTSEHISRRDVFKWTGRKIRDAAIVYVAAHSALPFLEKACDTVQLLTPENFPRYQKFSLLTAEELQNKTIVSIGDSIGHGFELGISTTYQEETFHPATEYVVEEVQKLDLKWKLINRARDGHTTEGAERQLDIAEQEGVLENKNIDVLLSAGGGNDLLWFIEGVQTSKQKLESVMQNPISPDSLDAAKIIVDQVNAYEKRFSDILNRLKGLKKNGKDIHRVILMGLPDLSLINTLSYEGILSANSSQESVNIKIGDNDINRMLARDISLLLNNAMLKAIAELRNPGFDVVFLDLFHTLQKEDLNGLHPNEKGYRKIAHLLMSQLFICVSRDGKISNDEKDTKISLLDMVNKQAKSK